MEPRKTRARAFMFFVLAEYIYGYDTRVLCDQDAEHEGFFVQALPVQTTGGM